MTYPISVISFLVGWVLFDVLRGNANPITPIVVAFGIGYVFGLSVSKITEYLKRWW